MQVLARGLRWGIETHAQGQMECGGWKQENTGKKIAEDAVMVSYIRVHQDLYV